MVLFHQVFLVFLLVIGHGKGSPNPHHKPNDYYFGPNYGLPLGGPKENLRSIEHVPSHDSPYAPINLINTYPNNYAPYSGRPISRVARHSDPRLYYPEAEELSQSPVFQGLMLYHEDYSAPQASNFSPELQRLMKSYQMLQEYLGNPNLRLLKPSSPIENNDYDEDYVVSGRLLEDNENGKARSLYGQHYASLALDKKIDASEQVDNIEDYYDDNDDEGNEEEEPPPNRRTFGLLAPVIESGLTAIDRGLEEIGITSSKGVDITRTRQTEVTLNSLREAREKASLEALRTQQTLQNLRNEAMQDSLQRKAEIDILRHQVDIIKEQKDKERQEKEEIRVKLEHEASLRERDREDLKRKYEYEVTIRDREANELQRKLQREEEKRQHEREELKRKMEMETTLHEINSKKNLLEMKSSYDTYLTTQNFKTVDDNRLPSVLGLGSSYYVPPFSVTGTIGVGVVS